MSRTTESARGETCSVSLPGCYYGTETTVFAHIAGVRFGHGMAKKTKLGAYACFKCHEIIDGRIPRPEGMTKQDVWTARGNGRDTVKTRRKGDNKTVNKDRIEKEFEHFFEFDTEDKSYVTSTSAKLFAKHIADIAEQELMDSIDNDLEGVNDLNSLKMAIYITKCGVTDRHIIVLDGFYINGLVATTGIKKQDVPKWVQAAVDSWAAFDAHLPITRQVKLLIVRELVNAYKKNMDG